MRPFTFLRPAVLLVVFLAWAATALYAQEEDIEDDDEGIIPIESDWSRLAGLYTRGDQTFCINVGIVVPLFFADQKTGYMSTQMKPGFMVSLAYNYFLGPNLFLGGELSGMFASTEGKNMFFIVPMGFRVGYQFVVSRFEFPLSGMIGFAPESYNHRTYFGFFAKPSAGGYFRFNSNWSFGINTSFWWVPQWTNKTREMAPYNGKVSIHGFFLEINLGARYHF